MGVNRSNHKKEVFRDVTLGLFVGFLLFTMILLCTDKLNLSSLTGFAIVDEEKQLLLEVNKDLITPLEKEEIITYRISIKNTGDDVAYNIRAEEFFPSDVRFVGSTLERNKDYEWWFESLEPGGEIVFDVSFIIPGSSDLYLFKNKIEVTYDKFVCDSDFECGSWGLCEDGVQERVCVDINRCNVEWNKPQVTKSCEEVYVVGEEYDVLADEGIRGSEGKKFSFSAPTLFPSTMFTFDDLELSGCIPILEYVDKNDIIDTKCYNDYCAGFGIDDESNQISILVAFENKEDGLMNIEIDFSKEAKEPKKRPSEALVGLVESVTNTPVTIYSDIYSFKQEAGGIYTQKYKCKDDLIEDIYEVKVLFNDDTDRDIRIGFITKEVR